ncbi:MAG: hypothetical protein QM809_07090 [Gordonia sp. (in: high G+C Gram-positive bacteria)]|uniref:hypothetical protein n=1 Tax=Gordonia sp. (in: high G+C Gram-positive bacteria) TaxID=84139 RepID=UPI0039E417DA
MRFNPPPNWPPPPSPEWKPEPGWYPDPAWGPPPDGWRLWTPEPGDDPDAIGPTPPFRPGESAESNGVVGTVLRSRPWLPLGAVVGIVVLVVAIYALMRDDSSNAPVELAAVTLGPVIELTGEFGGPGVVDEESQDVGVVPIDVTLKNNGDRPIRVTSIEVEVMQGDHVEQCHRGGAGPGRITADFTVKLPLVTENYTTRTRLGPTSSPVDFHVGPKDTDRMVITVGPEYQSHLFVELIAFKIALALDDGTRLGLPSVAAATAAETVDMYIGGAQGETSDSLDQHKSRCYSEMGALFDTAVEQTELQTEPLKNLRDAYASTAAKS